MLIREKLLRAEVAAAKAGVREVGGNNHGPEVKKFLAEVGLPEGYAWCDAFQSYEMHAAAGKRLPIESASVAQTYARAKQLGWVAATPCRGDLVLYDFDGDGQADDHIGIVVAATGLPGAWKLNTVEGNTGDGSAADGDGVYLRTRLVRRSSVRFVRIPGYIEPTTATATTGTAKVVWALTGNTADGKKPATKKIAKKPAAKKKPAAEKPIAKKRAQAKRTPAKKPLKKPPLQP